MHSGKLAIIFLSVGVLAFSSAPLFGQATFGVGSSSIVGADIGVTELTAPIIMGIASGLSVEAGFVVQYSAHLMNSPSSGITVTGTGGLAGVTAAAMAGSDSILINVPGGGAPGDSITIAGARVALAGNGYKTVSATIGATDSSGNAIIAGQNTVTVISAIKQPFSVTFDSTSNSSSILVKENYTHAFTSDIGVFGQTAATRLRINPFPAIPKGVTFTFPQTVSSPEDGATFTTTSGIAETIPRADGSTTVTYIYNGPPEPDLLLESFNFVAVVAVQPPTTGGIVAFQVTLLPIGIEVPDSSFPSTDVPRFNERPVPDQTDLITGTSQLAFPFQAQSAGTYTGIALTNPLNYAVKVTMTAYSADGTAVSGTNVNNPVTITMPMDAQLAKIANEIFGANFDLAGPGTIVAVGKTPVLAGFYLEGSKIGQALDGSTGNITPLQSWVWPSVSHSGPSPYTRFQLFNPGTAPATATLKLYGTDGTLLGSASQTVPAGGTAVRQLADLFPGANPATFTGGYVTGDSDIGLVVSENYGSALESNVLQGQTKNTLTTYNIAHFASGGGYATELSLVDPDPNVTGRVTISLLDTNGALYPVAGNPLKLNIAPKSQFIGTIGNMFPTLDPSLVTGYIRVDVEPDFLGPFGSPAPLAGSVRFSRTDGSASAALPLALTPAQDFVFSHVAQDLGYYTGVAILNYLPVQTSVQIEVFTKDGVSVGSSSTILQPGQKSAKLLTEIIPQSVDQLGGYIHIRADQPIVSFSLFGSTDGKVLSAIPPQSVAQ